MLLLAPADVLAKNSVPIENVPIAFNVDRQALRVFFMGRGPVFSERIVLGRADISHRNNGKLLVELMERNLLKITVSIEVSTAEGVAPLMRI